ncbi:hypothetical protein BG004_000990 [Podila humilis]|nr:hypothetical protein BG004_000990 [Podila humilis]
MSLSPRQQLPGDTKKQQAGGISHAFAEAGLAGGYAPAPAPASAPAPTSTAGASNRLVAPIATNPNTTTTTTLDQASSPNKDDNTFLTSSSPVFSGAHPFLRKFQTTVNKVMQQQRIQQQQQQQLLEQQQQQPLSRRGSPHSEAAAVMDSILAQRIGHLSVDNGNTSKDSTRQGGSTTSNPIPVTSPPNTGSQPLGQRTVGEMELFFDEDHDVQIDPTHFPPISDEAREFSDKLLGQNKAWAIKTEQDRPGFFARLEEQQKPQVLWIGCSDSRVPANQIVNLDPGEIFVHRNIANVVTHTDMNLLSVLEYAVEVLKVRHIIVCGHYGCGGVAASLTQKQFGIIDNWLRNIKDLYTIHRKKFDQLPAGSKEQKDLLTELNVIQSALNVCHTSIVQKTWARGEKLSIHGWCYRLSDGVIRNLGLCVEGPGDVEEVYHVMENDKTA